MHYKIILSMKKGTISISSKLLLPELPEDGKSLKLEITSEDIPGIDLSLDLWEDEFTWETTINFAPTDIENSENSKEFLANLENDSKWYALIGKFISLMGEVEIGEDFYWDEADLNMRFSFSKKNLILTEILNNPDETVNDY